MKRMNSSFIDWCVEVLESDNYVILDTETTGLGSDDQVVELAMIDASSFVLFSELLRPRCPIGEAAMKIHRITEDMVSGARSFKEAWPDIERAIGGRKIITWNAAFDARMLVQTAKANGITLHTIDFYCAMKGYSTYHHFQNMAKLAVACQQQGIDFVENHRALGDACAVLEIIRAIAAKATPVVDRSAIGGLSDCRESEATMARFQKSDVVPLHDWDEVRRTLQG